MNDRLQGIAVAPKQQTVSRCRFCQNYKPLKGQIGFCRKLNAPVAGKWKSCCLNPPSLIKIYFFLKHH